MSVYDFYAVLESQQLTVQPVRIEALWINITRRCNQVCLHCHVDASPERTEQMNLNTMDQCLKILGSLDSCKNLDITGGAPELHPHFEYLVVKARELGKHVIVRHNLTVTIDGDVHNNLEKTYLPSFFATAGYDRRNKAVVVKATNYHASPVRADIQLKGTNSVGSTGKHIVIRSDHPHDQNTLDNPRRIVPREQPLTNCAKRFSVTLPPYSVNVLRAPVGQ